MLQSCHTWDNGGSSSRASCEEFVQSASGFYSTHLWPRGSNHIIIRCNGVFSRPWWSEGQRDTLPEMVRHESGGSERSRVRRSGRGSVVFSKKEHAQFHICKRLRRTSHLLAGSSMTDLTSRAAASWRCCGTPGDHYHMQMPSSSEGSWLCVDNLSRSNAGQGHPRSPPQCFSIDVASFSLLHCEATRLGIGG